MKTAFLWLLFLMLATVLRTVSALPLYEPFNYAAGATLSGQTNSEGSIWAAVGTTTPPTDGTDQIVLTNRSLMSFGLPPSQANAAMFGGNGWGARIALGPPVVTSTSTNDFAVTNGTVYYSLILRIDNLGQTTSGGFICGFNNTLGSQGTQPTVVGARLFVRSAAGGFNLGLGKAPTNNTLQVIWDTETRGLGTNIFVVACYRFLGSPNSDDDEAYAWIQPDPSTFSEANPPQPTLTAPLFPPSLDLSSAKSFLLRQGNTQVPGVLEVDELRVGTTWPSVTPPPTLIVYRGDRPLVWVAWTTNISPTDFILESTPDLTPPAAWIPVSDTVCTDGDHYTVASDASSGNLYFRLRRSRAQ